MRIIKRRLGLALVFMSLLAICEGCTETKPFHVTEASPSETHNCGALYADADNFPPVAAVTPGESIVNPAAPDTDIDFQHHTPTDASSPCWATAWEHHRNYDLLFAEFDDQGWENLGQAPTSRIQGLIAHLNSLMRHGDNGSAQPLNLVVFVHGWHHSAEASDSNVKQFRFILDRTAEIETELSQERKAASSDYKWQQQRRVVGIYVGWRGDSIRPFLGIDNASIWDRKLAAENVSSGSVGVLFAELQSFYNANSCNRKLKEFATYSERDSGLNKDAILRSCIDVRMLVIGHSFGGLIVYRSLSNMLVANAIESYSPDAIDVPPAVSYGDLVMLINPAFEATRFESLAQASAARTYPNPAAASPQRGQLPNVIVVQSDGDTATGKFFPAFRNASTIFDDTPAPGESFANTHTVGWDPRYITHILEPGNGYLCKTSNRLDCEYKWWHDQRADDYRLFGGDLPLPDGLHIHPVIPRNQEIQRPPFDPVWVVASSSSVIGDHDDLLNIKFIRFVRQMYYGILHEEDCELLELASEKPEPTICPPTILALSKSSPR